VEHSKILRSIFDTFAPGDRYIPKASEVGLKSALSSGRQPILVRHNAWSLVHY
jgi:hypothetical protein